MDWNITQNFSSNIVFGILLFAMIIYWISLSLFRGTKSLIQVGKLSAITANILLFFILCSRWIVAGYFPLSNLYESLLFLTWTLLTIYLYLEFKTKSKLLGAILLPIALLINGFANLTLSADMQKSAPLVPALQSNWLMMHVSMMMLSYATLICGSLLAIAYLIFTQNQPQSEDQIVLSAASEQKAQKAEDQLSLAFSANQPNIQFPLSEQLPQKAQQESGPFSRMSLKEELSEKLDNLSYRLLGIGFPFLTIGILSGAVWANEAWGSYWSWDPKETWALATWLVFAMYLHTRLTKGWKGRKSAFLAAFGFIIVWVCFLGVNLLGEGLHSYGFFQK